MSTAYRVPQGGYSPAASAPEGQAALRDLLTSILEGTPMPERPIHSVPAPAATPTPAAVEGWTFRVTPSAKPGRFNLKAYNHPRLLVQADLTPGEVERFAPETSWRTR